jgi:hypothetical protein
MMESDDWVWLEKLAMISVGRSRHELPPEVLARLEGFGYLRQGAGGFSITAAGRKVIRARNSGEEY